MQNSFINQEERFTSACRQLFYTLADAEERDGVLLQQNLQSRGADLWRAYLKAKEERDLLVSLVKNGF